MVDVIVDVVGINGRGIVGKNWIGIIDIRKIVNGVLKLVRMLENGCSNKCDVCSCGYF